MEDDNNVLINENELNKKSAIELIFNDAIEVEEEDDGVIDIDALTEILTALSKNELRQDIYENVADLDSLFGTTSDAAQVLIVMMITQTEALKSATTFEEYKSGVIARTNELSGSEQSFDLYASESTKLLNAIVAKQVVMPYMIKSDGIMGVIKDVSERATSVAQKILEKLSS